MFAGVNCSDYLNCAVFWLPELCCFLITWTVLFLHRRHESVGVAFDLSACGYACTRKTSLLNVQYGKTVWRNEKGRWVRGYLTCMHKEWTACIMHDILKLLRLVFHSGGRVVYTNAAVKDTVKNASWCWIFVLFWMESDWVWLVFSVFFRLDWEQSQSWCHLIKTAITFVTTIQHYFWWFSLAMGFSGWPTVVEIPVVFFQIELEVADQTSYLTQSQYTDTGLTSPSTDPIMPGSWQGSHWSANF